MNVLAVVEAPQLAAQVRRVLEPVTDGLWLADGLDDARRLLDEEPVGVVVAEFLLEEGRATELLDGAAHDAPFPLVVLGRKAEPGEAEVALEEGAVDYLPTDAAAVRALPHVLRGAMREHSLRERARIAEDRLMHANRLMGVGRLAAMTAHEVGTPLNVARMQAQLISAEDTADERMRRSCGVIVSQIDVVSARLRAMLDFARLGDRGRGPINLREAVHSAVELLEPLARRQGVSLQVDGPDLLVVANRSQIQQVVFNLVTNALHALDKEGEVDVRVRREEREGRVFGLLEVVDDGPGVAESVADHLFDAFVTTKPAGRGTGLGLAVCHDIATDHGGWIEVATRPGETRVQVGLPAAQGLASSRS